MQSFIIQNLSTDTEITFNINMLVADLSIINENGRWDEVNKDRFIFLLESSIAKRILEHNPQFVLKLDMRDFVKDTLTIAQNSVDYEVYYHKDYASERRRFNKRMIRYEKIFNMSVEERSEIPQYLYEHLFSYYRDGTSLTDFYAVNNQFLPKKLIPQALINVTAGIVDKLSCILVHNEGIDELKNVIENDFKRKDFGNLKTTVDPIGDKVKYYETSLQSYTHTEQKILYYALFINSKGENKEVQFRTTKALWEILIMIFVSFSTNSYIHYGVEEYIEISFEDIVVFFELHNNQYRITFSKK